MPEAAITSLLNSSLSLSLSSAALSLIPTPLAIAPHAQRLLRRIQTQSRSDHERINEAVDDSSEETDQLLKQV